jgi:Mg2+/Co2+ transporter CorB
MISDLWLAIIAVALIVFAMLMVGLEQALTRVSKARVTEMQENGIRGADKLAPIVADRARYVNAVLLARLAAEAFATVTVTVACVRQFPDPMWLGPTIAGVIMLFVAFVGPRSCPQNPGTAARAKCCLKWRRIREAAVRRVRTARLVIDPHRKRRDAWQGLP